MQISVHADMKSTKQGIFQQKTPNNNQVVVKSVLDSNCKSFRDTAIRERLHRLH